MARNHAPLSSFGTELQATLREGANRHIEIVFPNKSLAIRFTQRINALRNAMRTAKHPDWENLYRCGVYPDPIDPCKLTIGPKDSEFRSILASAGIGVDTPPPEVTSVTIEEPAPGSVDSFLADITEATSVQAALSEIEEEPEPDVNSL